MAIFNDIIGSFIKENLEKYVPSDQKFEEFLRKAKRSLITDRSKHKNPNEKKKTKINLNGIVIFEIYY